MKRKLIALLLALVIVFSFASCSSCGDGEPDQGNNSGTPGGLPLVPVYPQ